MPSDGPTTAPTTGQTGQPSGLPSVQPSGRPTAWPSLLPSEAPSTTPSGVPAAEQVFEPSAVPTNEMSVVNVAGVSRTTSDAVFEVSETFGLTPSAGAQMRANDTQVPTQAPSFLPTVSVENVDKDENSVTKISISFKLSFDVVNHPINSSDRTLSNITSGLCHAYTNYFEHYFKVLHEDVVCTISKINNKRRLTLSLRSDSSRRSLTSSNSNSEKNNNLDDTYQVDIIIISDDPNVNTDIPIESTQSQLANLTQSIINDDNINVAVSDVSIESELISSPSDPHDAPKDSSNSVTAQAWDWSQSNPIASISIACVVFLCVATSVVACVCWRRAKSTSPGKAFNWSDVVSQSNRMTRSAVTTETNETEGSVVVGGSSIEIVFGAAGRHSKPLPHEQASAIHPHETRTCTNAAAGELEPNASKESVETRARPVHKPARQGYLSVTQQSVTVTVTPFSSQMLSSVTSSKHAMKISAEDITIESRIGGGRFGEVYLARWHSELVAVKQLKVSETVTPVSKSVYDAMEYICPSTTTKSAKIESAAAASNITNQSQPAQTLMSPPYVPTNTLLMPSASSCSGSTSDSEQSCGSNSASSPIGPLPGDPRVAAPTVSQEDADASVSVRIGPEDDAFLRRVGNSLRLSSGTNGVEAVMDAIIDAKEDGKGTREVMDPMDKHEDEVIFKDKKKSGNTETFCVSDDDDKNFVYVSDRDGTVTESENETNITPNTNNNAADATDATEVLAVTSFSAQVARVTVPAHERKDSETLTLSLAAVPHHLHGKHTQQKAKHTKALIMKRNQRSHASHASQMSQIRSHTVVASVPSVPSVTSASELSREQKELFGEIVLANTIPYHPNLVRYFGFIENEEKLSLVMQYMHGGSMETYCYNAKKKLRKLPFEQVWYALSKACNGLKFLNKYKLVHRDVAARNILLGKLNGKSEIDENTEIKIADFGMTRLLIDEDPNSNGSKNGSHNKSINNFGPIRWMAPESIQFFQYNEYSDVYMYGMSIYEILKQEEPYFSMKNIVHVAASVIKFKNRPDVNKLLQQYDNNVNIGKLLELAQDCWKHESSQRPSFEQVTKRLNQIWKDRDSVSGREDNAADNTVPLKG